MVHGGFHWKNRMLYRCCSLSPLGASTTFPMDTGAFVIDMNLENNQNETKRTVMEIFSSRSFSGFDITPMYFARDMKLFP
jgi:hypothetical protein